MGAVVDRHGLTLGRDRSLLRVSRPAGATSGLGSMAAARACVAEPVSMRVAAVLCLGWSPFLSAAGLRLCWLGRSVVIGVLRSCHESCHLSLGSLLRRLSCIRR